MFKSLLAATTIALATALPSFAAPSTCWLGVNERNGNLPAQTCDVNVRTNANGTNVIDIYTPVDGGMMSVVLWHDGNHNPEYAEVFFEGSKFNMNYRYDNAGDLHLWNDNTEFYVGM